MAGEVMNARETRVMGLRSRNAIGGRTDRAHGRATWPALNGRDKTQKFEGGYDSYLTHLQRSGGFSNVINTDYDKALLRHEKEGTLTPKERDALVTLKYRKRHMGI